MKSILSLLLITGAALSAQAQVYRWVDEQGRVQYSDRKPEDGKAKPAQTTQLKISAPPVTARSAEDVRAEQDHWKRVLAARPQPVAAPSSSNRYPSPPGDQASACDKARYWAKAARDGKAVWGRGASRTAIDEPGKELLDREAADACRR